MIWKLIFSLSLFGLAMAIGTVYFIPGKIEWMFWLPIFLLCAYLVAKNAPGKYFMHGFFISLVNCVWITSAHVLLFDSFMKLNPEMWAMNNMMPMPTHPRIMMLLTGPVFGIIFGLILGLFAWIASKIVKK